MAAKSMSMRLGSTDLKGLEKDIREAKYFDDNGQSSLVVPRGFMNQSSIKSGREFDLKDPSSVDGCVISTSDIDKVDDVLNGFFVQHQRIVRKTITLRDTLTLIPIPKSFLQKFKPNVNGTFFRIGFLGVMGKPLYTQRKTTIKVGIADFRGDLNHGRVSKETSEIVTTRNAHSLVDRSANSKGESFEWINYVSFPSDVMTFSGMNADSYFSVKDWDLCKIAISIKDSITKNGVEAMTLDLLISLDESSNPQKYKLAVVPTTTIEDREVKLLKNAQQVMKLVESRKNEIKLLNEADSLLFDEGNRATHRGARVLNLKETATGVIL